MTTIAKPVLTVAKEVDDHVALFILNYGVDSPQKEAVAARYNTAKCDCQHWAVYHQEDNDKNPEVCPNCARTPFASDAFRKANRNSYRDDAWNGETTNHEGK